MLHRENYLRLSSEVQDLYRKGGYDAYVSITEGVQQQVCVPNGHLHCPL